MSTSSPRTAGLERALHQLEDTYGPADPPPSGDGWRLVLAENVGYLVDDDRRWGALAVLERTVGLEPALILAAPDAALRRVVVGPAPGVRIARLRRCAELAIAGAPWAACPGIGRPGADRIDLFTGARAVLALDANGMRVLARLGYGSPDRSYAAAYRLTQAEAMAQLPNTVASLVRAHQLLRRHGRDVCRRKEPACFRCPITSQCPSAGSPPPLY